MMMMNMTRTVVPISQMKARSVHFEEIVHSNMNPLVFLSVETLAKLRNPPETAFQQVVALSQPFSKSEWKLNSFESGERKKKRTIYNFSRLNWACAT